MRNVDTVYGRRDLIPFGVGPRPTGAAKRTLFSVHRVEVARLR